MTNEHWMQLYLQAWDMYYDVDQWLFYWLYLYKNLLCVAYTPQFSERIVGPQFNIYV